MVAGHGPIVSQQLSYWGRPASNLRAIPMWTVPLGRGPCHDEINGRREALESLAASGRFRGAGHYFSCPLAALFHLHLFCAGSERDGPGGSAHGTADCGLQLCSRCSAELPLCKPPALVFL